MTCPKCHSFNIHVTNVLQSPSGRIFRLRKCNDCGKSFRSVETMDDGSEEFKKGYSEAYDIKYQRFRK